MGGTQQPALASVAAGNNALKALPEGFSSASALARLEIAHNELRQVDGHVLAGCSMLTELDLTHNQLTVRCVHT